MCVKKQGLMTSIIFHSFFSKLLDVRRQIIEMKLVKFSRDFMKYLIVNQELESDMRRRDKLKQTGDLKTNGSMMNKIFISGILSFMILSSLLEL